MRLNPAAAAIYKPRSYSNIELDTISTFFYNFFLLYGRFTASHAFHKCEISVYKNGLFDYTETLRS
ncbi:MAG: hypothetical protein AMJ54_16555 [Deltaproteobacteria bacterium SG8_13]|nr:MAG: hypothetical protein AMJ54_16555 [Deltaproteobacteria bacterium SG8_13]